MKDTDFTFKWVVISARFSGSWTFLLCHSSKRTHYQTWLNTFLIYVTKKGNFIITAMISARLDSGTICVTKVRTRTFSIRNLVTKMGKLCLVFIKGDFNNTIMLIRSPLSWLLNAPVPFIISCHILVRSGKISYTS